MSDPLCEDCARPKRDQIAGVENYKQGVELVFAHVNVPKYAHDACLPQSRLVEVDEKRDPPGLRQKTPKVLSHKLRLVLGCYCSHIVFIAIVEQGCIVDICSGEVVGAKMVCFAAGIRLDDARNSFFVSNRKNWGFAGRRRHYACFEWRC